MRRVRGKFLQLTPDLYEYVVEHGARRDGTLRDVERTTEALGSVAAMQTAADEGAFLTLLARLVGSRRAVEVGTFTGYSAVCLARGLAPGGSLLCCELSEEYAATARRNVDAAGVGDRIEIRTGPALDTLSALPRDEEIDLAFIDADKAGYSDYVEELLSRLRPGGLLVLDNVLLGGRVLAPAADDEAALAVAALNERLAADERVDITMLPIADGVTLLRKR